MKKLFLLLGVALLATTPMYAQELSQKKTTSNQTTNLSKAVKKEAKKLAKEGWRVVNGLPSLEMQLKRYYEAYMALDDNLLPKYIFGNATSRGAGYNMAKFSALAWAQQDLARQIESQRRAISASDAAAVFEIVDVNIGKTTPIMECYRILKNKEVEVCIRLAYNVKYAKKR